MDKEKNFPQGFKRGDLVCWVDFADEKDLSYCGIVVEPFSFKSVSFGTQFRVDECLWIIWCDGKKSRHVAAHMRVIAEAENET